MCNGENMKYFLGMGGRVTSHFAQSLITYIKLSQSDFHHRIRTCHCY